MKRETTERLSLGREELFRPTALLWALLVLFTPSAEASTDDSVESWVPGWEEVVSGDVDELSAEDFASRVEWELWIGDPNLGIALAARFEQRFAKDRPVLSAKVALSVGVRMVKRAEATRSPEHWNAVRDYLIAMLERYTGKDTHPEQVQVLAYLGDAYRLGAPARRFRAKQAYREATARAGKPIEDDESAPLDEAGAIEQRHEARDNRRDELLTWRERQRIKVRKRGKPPGILSYLSATNAPTSPFGPDTARDVPPENTTGQIPFVSGPVFHTDDDDERRRVSMLDAAAKARYELAIYGFRDYLQIRLPEFQPILPVPKKVRQWYAKKQPQKELKLLEKERQDRRRLARWGFYNENKPIREQMKDVLREERWEDKNVLFEYWLTHDFALWYERKVKALEVVTERFAQVAELHVPRWEMAAVARIGDMQLDFAESLYNAPLPPSISRNPELIDVYRSSMGSRYEAFRTPIKYYKLCISIASHFRWYDETAQYCEHKLRELEPREYNLVGELVFQAQGVAEPQSEPLAILVLDGRLAPSPD